MQETASDGFLLTILVAYLLATTADGFSLCSVCAKSTDETHLKAKADANAGEDLCPTRRNVILSTAAATAIGACGLYPDTVEAVPNGASAAENPPFASAFFDPVVPFSSRRQYKQVTLATNGLRVLLVADKQAYRASAALSIQNAGQFSEPPEVPGLAHLLEHMVLSSSTKGMFLRQEQKDFEEWLGDNEGASNAFTAPGMVCFHFNSPPQVFPEALGRFATLFVQDNVEKICRDEATIRREIRRVDAELDYSNDVTQAFYLSKASVNAAHPFSRFGAGNLDSLETKPKEQGIDIGEWLIEFFVSKYLPSNAVLVVVCPTDVFTLERWVTPFAITLSRRQGLSKPDQAANDMKLPEPFPIRSKLAQIVLFRPKSDSSVPSRDTEKLSFEWPLQIDYAGRLSNGQPVISAPAVGCIIAQILARRGPGSLYLFLQRRGWAPRGNQGLPRITFPVDVSGFQMMKLEIGLTLDGFANRSAVIAAVYDSIRKITRIGQPARSFLLPRELLNQYVTVATLHGYVLASRPPDAVELAMDVQQYGVGTIASWPILPSVDDMPAMSDLRKAVSDTLELMNDPTRVIIMITASCKAVETSSFVDETLPIPTSSRWEIESSTGGRYYVESPSKFPGYVEAWVTARLDEEELLPPVLNPLVPPVIRPPRLITERSSSDGGRRIFYQESPGDTVWREFLTQAPDNKAADGTSWEERTLASLLGKNWKLYLSPETSPDYSKLPLPIGPKEPTCRAAFVLQLLSPRPARADVRRAAAAQLWMMSFHNAVSDLAELGAPAGLAYATSFNKYGLRICFLGISQNLPSYIRRICRRLATHHTRLFGGTGSSLNPSAVQLAIADVNRATTLSSNRKRRLVSTLRTTSSTKVASEGASFLGSCTGAICLAQGDFLPKEAVSLVRDVQNIFDAGISVEGKDRGAAAAIPIAIEDILYKPYWRPRGASQCLLPGIPLVSNPCGRIQR